MLRYVGGTMLCAIVGFSLIPPMDGARAGAVVHINATQAKLNQLQKEIKAAQDAQKLAEPIAAAAELHSQTSSSFNRMLGELYQVLDSAKSGMAFSSAKIEIREAEAMINCHGDAESYDIAAAFAEQAGATPSKVSALSSTRPNGLLAPTGIAFEYIKQVPLQ